MMLPLTDKQITLYQQEGYLVIEDAINQRLLDELCQVKRLMIGFSKHVKQSNDVYELDVTHSESNPKVRRLINPHLHHSAYNRLRNNPILTQYVQSLIGHNFRFQGSRLNLKPAATDNRVDWHQDCVLACPNKDNGLSVVVMLEDCGPEDGPMMLIPGSHTSSVYEHSYDGLFTPGIDMQKHGVDTADAITLTGLAGTLIIHHVRLLNASAQNTHIGDRPLLLYSYCAE